MTEKELEFTIRILKDIIENNGGTYLVNRYRELQQQLKDLKDKNKETLEEAAIRLYPDNIIKLGNETSYNAASLKRKDFIDGGNWVKERSFSEEDMKKAIRFGFDKGFCSNSSNKVKNNLPSEKEWFDQFKKK